MRWPVAAAVLVSVIAAATAAAHPLRSEGSDQRAAGTTVKTVFNQKLKSTILVTGKGLTLYYWTQDVGRKSSCVNDSTYHCSKWWPPLLTTGNPVATGGAKQSLLGITKRAGGQTQVTYAGHPVYRWVGVGSPAPDKKAGDVYGQGFISQWWALSPAGKPVKKLAK
jgi:predicted lipoprotein with Yx(FWY)xxD motif